MKKIIFILLLISTVALAAPDLQVLDLQYTAGGRLVANIYNQAPEGLNQSITVAFYDNDNQIGTFTYADPLPRYSVFSAYIDYIPQKGNHTFRALVDPESKINEKSDSNNERTITFEQKSDTTPRNATPEKNAAGITAVPQTSQPTKEAKEVILPGNIITILIVIIVVLLILLSLRLLHLRGRLKFSRPKDGGAAINEKEGNPPAKAGKQKDEKQNGYQQKSEKAGFLKRKAGNDAKIKIVGAKSAMEMGAGSKATIKAALTFNGKVGDDYTYFIRDGSGEFAAVSKEKLENKSYTMDCTVESFMKTEKILRITSAR